VLVLWAVPFASRFSFYQAGKVQPILIHDPPGVRKNLFDSYLEFLGDTFEKDTILETYFYINVIKNICRLSNYSFLYFNVDVKEGEQVDQLFSSDEHSLNLNHSVFGLKMYSNPWSFCGHPNEFGYSVISDRIYQRILEKHPYLINDTTPNHYEAQHRELLQW
jgi:hypothetical protein